MITVAAEYFEKGCGRCSRFDTPDCSIHQWNQGLLALRRICLKTGLHESAKWGHPVYMHEGRNIAIIGAFRGDFRLTFFNAALMKDPHHLLTKQGANTRHPGMLSFTGLAGVIEIEPIIVSYLEEAMVYADAGIRPAKETAEPELPDELVEVLDSDPELAEAFRALTPGRRKSYAINLASAKQAATRHARIEKFRPRILAGKGANEY